jgi:hypothetical protein
MATKMSYIGVYIYTDTLQHAIRNSDLNFYAVRSRLLIIFMNYHLLCNIFFPIR